MKLQFKPGAPVSRILWTGPFDLVSCQCSLCRVTFDEDETPFRLMGETRFAAFCDSCFRLCFEIVPSDDS